MTTVGIWQGQERDDRSEKTFGIGLEFDIRNFSPLENYLVPSFHISIGAGKTARNIEPRKQK